MIKRVQNLIAESRLALPATATFTLCIWLLSGLSADYWWLSLTCFALSLYLIIELNNANALIRIYSRMVSCSFLMLSCVACFLFRSHWGSVTELLVIAAYLTLFTTYQDRQSTGWTYYTFLLLSLASLISPHLLYFIPVYWLLMAFKVQSLSWRTFWASVIGLLTPYWFAGAVLIYDGDMDWFISHFTQLATTGESFDYHQLSTSEVATYIFVAVMAMTGIIHYLRTRYNDKIRVRLLFDCFIIMDLLAGALLAWQPQHYDLLMRLMIINTSPLIGHFIALTHTRWTNWAFYIIIGATLSLTAYNLWMLL